jgi:shikimate kinase
MGSGKSTHGKKLAKELAYQFIDLDTYIEEKESMTVQQIFNNFGEQVFREKETEYLNEVISKTGNIIISLGGGTICFHSNLTRVLNSGLLIYIYMPAEALYDRLKNSVKDRPLLKEKNPTEIQAYIKETLMQRSTFYNQAHITINGISLTTATIKQAILSA